jgi:hypothetical protein
MRTAELAGALRAAAPLDWELDELGADFTAFGTKVERRMATMSPFSARNYTSQH